MTVKLLTEHNFGDLSLKGGCTGLCNSTLTSQNATLLEISCCGSIIYMRGVIMHEFLFIKLQFHIIILNSSQSSIKHDAWCLWAPQTNGAFINRMTYAHLSERGKS